MRHATCPAVRFMRSLGSPLQRGAPFKYVDPGSLSPRLRCWLFAKPQPYEPTLHVEKCRKCRKKCPMVGFLTAQSHFRQQFSGKLLPVLCLWAQKDNISEKSRIIRWPFVGFFLTERKNSQPAFHAALPKCCIYFENPIFYNISP